MLVSDELNWEPKPYCSNATALGNLEPAAPKATSFTGIVQLLAYRP